ncbi:MAG: DivIVA domain-containing protein [Actinomycetota bacterium]|nr:DivIVA domain-containing protein [Actinomycetota bacterium]
MPFTPEEIENKEFLITLRGYDKDEVQAFLRAVAEDFRGLSSTVREAPAGGNAFEALGEEVSSVLRVAKESATALRKKAEDEAAQARKRAEEEANTLREAASQAARRLTSEAQKHATEVRAAAQREADDRLRDMARRVERLQSTESKLRQRLYALEMMLQSMRQDLDAADAAGVELKPREATAAGLDADGDTGSASVLELGADEDSSVDEPSEPSPSSDSAAGEGAAATSDAGWGSNEGSDSGNGARQPVQASAEESAG